MGSRDDKKAEETITISKKDFDNLSYSIRKILKEVQKVLVYNKKMHKDLKKDIKDIKPVNSELKAIITNTLEDKIKVLNKDKNKTNI